MDDFFKTLVEAIRTTLEKCPPDLAGDVIERGILLCGGGALLEGIGNRIQDETGIPVHIAGEPLDCTAIGAGMMLGDYRDQHASAWRTDKNELRVESEVAG